MPSLLRLLRAIAWGLVTFIASFAVYVLLPSPPVSEDTLANNLRNGLPVMRAYSVEHFMPNPTFTWETRQSLDDLFAFSWLFSPANSTLFINGEPIFKFQSEQQSLSNTEKEVQVISGAKDGISLPWFNLADATLMTNDILPKYGMLSLHILHRLTLEDGAPTYDVLTVPASGRSTDIPPLLTVVYRNSENGTLVPTFYFPQMPFSASPSTTFPIRRALIYCLAPVAFIALFSLKAASVAVKFTFWVSIVWLCWAIAFGPLKSYRSGLIERAPSATSVVQNDNVADQGVDGDRSKEGKEVTQSADDIV